MTKRERRIFCISFALAPIVYALLAAWSYGQRGYFAFGGEIMAFTIPMFTYVGLYIHSVM